MFKRSIASCVAIAALSTAVVAPANAVEVKVAKKGEAVTCTFTPSEKEIKDNIFSAEELEAFKTPVELKKADAAVEADSLASQVNVLKIVQQGTEKALEAAKTEEQKKELTEILNEGKQKIAKQTLLAHAYRSCAQGEDQSQLSSDAKVALSAADAKPNEAGIGVIVAGAVLGVLTLFAAALPAIAPMLPQPLRDLLHI